MRFVVIILMCAGILKAIVRIWPVRWVLMIKRGLAAKATAITAGAWFHAQISQYRWRHQPDKPAEKNWQQG